MKTSSPTLAALAGFLGLIGLLFVGMGVWLSARCVASQCAAVGPGLVGLVVGLACVAAGAGLYRRRRWGVVLFGLLSVGGSSSFIGSGLLGLSGPAVGAAAFQAVSGLLFAAALAYLTIRLWKEFPR